MRENDVIVIGGGLAGLIAAAAAAQRGKQVLVMTKGVGTIAIGGGIIDVLGYGPEGNPLFAPRDGFGELSPDHPYKLIGEQGVGAAVEFFLSLCQQEGYPYAGSLDANVWLPTALGTMKPSCLVPETMASLDYGEPKQIIVASFTGLKDYSPKIIAAGLAQIPGCKNKYETLMLETGFSCGRDVSALDIARWLETDEGWRSCASQIAKTVPAGSVILLPPVLGTNPDYRFVRKMEEATGCRFMETVGMPPAVTGLRLRKMLVRYLKRLGVRIIEEANVIRAVVDNGRCRAVVTGNFDRERSYQANSFILATGGYFGGGIRTDAEFAQETIFNLPVAVPSSQEKWSNEKLFSGTGQPFAAFGLAVDAKLRPVDSNGEVLLENVYIAGRNLAGYDFCVEKSGNGVALASGYRAGISV